MQFIENKATRLAIFLGTFFIANMFIAEFIGVKIFSLESTLGLSKFSFSLFGKEQLSFDLTCGVLLWPFVFVLTDIINEYFGVKGVRMLSWLAVFLISYAFMMFYLGMQTVPASWWPATKTAQGIPDMNEAFKAIFGQGLWIIIGSIVAFLIGQVIDVTIFHWIKKKTGERWLWLRSTGSTIVSQLIDSFVVLYVAFKLGADWDWQLVFAIGTVNFCYKFLMALLMTPVIYAVHALIERYLGKELATSLRQKAIAE